MTSQSPAIKSVEQAAAPQDMSAVIGNDLGAVLIKKKPKQEDEEQPSFIWLLTFTDIMALMLTFFVLLYSMSTPREKEWEQMSKGLNAELNQHYTPAANLGDHEEIQVGSLDFSQALNLDYLGTIIKDAIAKDQRLKEITIIPQRDSLVISVPQHVLFQTGKLEISQDGRQVIFALSAALNHIRNRIEVVGHADPFSGESKALGLTSDWDISLLRAGAVASVLQSAGYKRSISFRGLSSGRYTDLPMNVEEPQKRALSQRLDIVIMKDDGSIRPLLAVEDSG
jgi:chemotaxis protein MotB